MVLSELISKGATNLDLSNILESKKTELTRLKGVKNNPPFIIGSIKKLETEIIEFTNLLNK